MPLLVIGWPVRVTPAPPWRACPGQRNLIDFRVSMNGHALEEVTAPREPARAGRRVVLVGLMTRRDLIDHARPGTLRVREIVRRKPVVVYEDNSLREAADHMVREEVGRVAVVSRAQPLRAIGILS